MKIRLKNQSDYVKEVKIGFSWTTLFFGFFVPLFRGDWKWVLIMVIVCIITCWAACIPFAFIYNRQYIKGMLEKGWTASDGFSANALESKGFIYSDVLNKYSRQ